MSPRAWAELLLLALLWGGSFVAIRIALDEVPVITMVVHRTGWAALVLWAVVALLRLPVAGAIADRMLVRKVERLLDSYGHADFITDSSQYKPVMAKAA